MGRGQFHIVAIQVDGDGGVELGSPTLDSLVRNIKRAVDSGVPLDAPVKYGYIPALLDDGLFVEMPLDYKSMRFDELRDRASSVRQEVCDPAWAELRRRVEAFGLAGED